MIVLVYQDSQVPDGEQFAWCVKSINAHSPGARIVRFGTEKSIKGLCEFEPISRWTRSSATFSSVYVHHHPCKPWFTLRSINRWFVFYDYCLANGIKTFFSLDSDVLIFGDLDKTEKVWGETPISVQYVSSCTMSTLGCCFIRDISIIADFGAWLMQLYQTKKVVERLGGDVCDMGLWTLFLRDRPEWRWNDLYQPREGTVFDCNLTLTDGWKAENGSKAFVWKNHKPYAVYKGQEVQLNSMHCWGPWKTRMEELWRRSIL